MEPIRVMIVDDEILAVEDIIDLINWEELGFEIVATAKNGRQALDKFAVIRPDVIISDIRMPVMDGLEMSKAVLVNGRNVKIVLLTGYEEFEYAKKAVKIGVFDYILKNEINKSVLSAKILELKDVIRKEKYESSLVLRNLLKEIITVQGSETGRLPDLMRLHSDQVYLLLFELDFSFLSVISDFNEEKYDQILDVNQLGVNIGILPEGFQLLEIIPVEKHRVALLLGQSSNLSEYETGRSLSGLARRIQQNFRAAQGRTLSAYIYPRKIKMSRCHDIYKLFRQISKYKVFFGKEKLFDAASLKLEIGKNGIEIDERAFIQGIDELDIEKTGIFIEQIFNSVIWPRYNLEGFITVIKEFLHILQNLKRMLHRSDIGYGSPEASVNEEMWFKAEDIRQWFADEFTYVITGMEKASRSKLSWEVQKSIDYIHKFYYKEDLTIGEVSEKIGLSVTHLSVKLKKETGMTFLEYLTNYRVEKAKKLLVSENCKIYEISNRIGYKTSQYFSKVFYKATGKTPIDYRKEVT
jgi:two-component system response regulator YesN